MSTRVILKNIPFQTKEELTKAIHSKFGEMELTDIHMLYRDNVFRRCAFVGLKSRDDAKQLQSLDGYFLGSCRIKAEFAREKASNASAVSTSPPTLEDVKQVEETHRLYITNIPFSTKEEELKTYFEKYGPVADAHIPIDKLTKKSKGMAYIEFMDSVDAVRLYCNGAKAIKKKRKTNTPTSTPTLVYSGREIMLFPSEKKPEEPQPTTIKEAKTAEKKRVAQMGFSWNTLYLNPSTILANTAQKLDMKTSEVLDLSSEGVAVRMSVAEVEELGTIKAWFAEHGVSCDAFKRFEGQGDLGPDTRSDTTLLIKNLSPQFDDNAFIELLKQYGDAEKVLVPPSRQLAIVEYASNTEAKVAFKKLSYKPFQGLPLYLEWAPMACLKEATGIQIGQLDKEEEDTNELSSVFVKNISFDTKESTFQALFSKLPGFHSATLKTRVEDGKSLSMGYGFVEFVSFDDAQNCVRVMSNTVLEKHELEIRLSNKSQPQVSNKRKVEDIGDASNKLVIKNLPFETNHQEVFDLLATTISIQSLRLPQKFDGSLRGFAFVQCHSIHDAKLLMKKMNGVHFYGRKLVFMFSDQETKRFKE